jgi:hypothetical protein
MEKQTPSLSIPGAVMKKIWTIFILFVLHASVLVGAKLEVVQDEFQINQNTIDRQDHATVSMNQSGVSFVAWHDFSEIDGDRSTSMGRLFTDTGLAVTDEFIINESTEGHQRVPDVATDGDTIFVVAYSGSSTITRVNVFAKLYSSLGTVLVSEYQVNNVLSESKTYPDVGMYDNGNFVVIWNRGQGDTFNFYVRAYDSYGTPLSDPAKINKVTSDDPPTTPDNNGLPDIAVNQSGDAVAVWERVEGNNITVVVRLFNIYTRIATWEYLVDPPALGIIQRRPMVDMNDAGDVLVTWIEHSDDLSDADVFAKRYYADTNKWGEKIRPHDDTAGLQSLTVGRLTEEGQFALLWTDKGDVYMRFYNAHDVAISNEVLVNTTVGGMQKRPSLDWQEYVDYTLMFITYEGEGQGGDPDGVYGKIFKIYR